jgi:hypothetical protein
MMREMPKRSGAALAVTLLALESLPLFAAEPVRSLDIVEASAFLEGYRAASEAQNPDFYDLYSDRAVVHAHIQDHDQGVAFQGRAFKAWGRELLQERRTGLDGSIFRDVTVEQRGNRLLIHAKRYSTTRCYWDPTYQVGIEREGPSYRIVDERLTTNPLAHCLPERVKTVAPLSRLSPEWSLPALETTRLPGAASTLDWHPLSEQELADKAMRLAQQIATARAVTPSSSATVLTQRPVVSAEGSASVASTGRGDASGGLRVTPQE